MIWLSSEARFCTVSHTGMAFYDLYWELLNSIRLLLLLLSSNDCWSSAKKIREIWKQPKSLSIKSLLFKFRRLEDYWWWLLKRSLWFPRLFFARVPREMRRKVQLYILLWYSQCCLVDLRVFPSEDFFVDVSGHDWIQKSSDLLCSSSAALQDFLTRKRTSFLAPLVYVVFPQQPPAFDKVVGNFPEEQRRSHPFFPLLWRFSKWP